MIFHDTSLATVGIYPLSYIYASGMLYRISFKYFLYTKKRGDALLISHSSFDLDCWLHCVFLILPLTWIIGCTTMYIGNHITVNTVIKCIEYGSTVSGRL